MIPSASSDGSSVTVSWTGLFIFWLLLAGLGVGVALRTVCRKNALTPQKSDWSHCLFIGWSWHCVHWVWMPRNSRVTRDVIGTASKFPYLPASLGGSFSPRWKATKLTAPPSDSSERSFPLPFAVIN